MTTPMLLESDSVCFGCMLPRFDSSLKSCHLIDEVTTEWCRWRVNELRACWDPGEGPVPRENKATSFRLLWLCRLGAPIVVLVISLAMTHT